MVAPREVDSGSRELAKLPPESGHELRPPVRQDAPRKPEKSADVDQQDLGCLLGRGHLGKRNEPDHLRKTVHHRKDGGVTLRSRTWACFQSCVDCKERHNLSQCPASHQNLSWTLDRVRRTPGWQDSKELWVQVIAWPRTPGGTNRRLLGVSGGTCNPSLAC